MHLSLVLMSLAAVVLAQKHDNTDFYCQMYQDRLNCNEHHSHHGDHDVYCGSNGVTFNSRCELGAAHCKDNTIHQLYVGACTNGNMTTPSLETLEHGANVVFDVFCSHLMHHGCDPATSAAEKVCGTNNRTYPTYCEYEKGRCTHRDLHVQHPGDCSA